MLYLYVDNFRGFSRTLLPMEDVNFFVGENSTGKTSILSLVSVLESAEFWVGQSFRTRFVELGNFEDIVSMFSQDRTYFDIGIMRPTKDKGGGTENKYQAFLMTFVRRKAMPAIKRYTFVLEDEEIQVKYIGDQLYYKIVKPEKIGKDINSVKELFAKWTSNHRETGGGFRIIKAPMIVKASIGTLNAFFERMLKKERVEVKGGVSVTMPALFHNLRWLAPIRTQPQRTYDRYDIQYSAEGEHTPYTIRKLLSSRKDSERFTEFMRKFGKESGLFELVGVKRFGGSSTAPFEIDITLSGKRFNMVNVGYGVSQILPIVVELFEQRANTWFAIQQPEIHLHPRGQSALGDLIFNLAIAEDKKFIVETHSDFMIDRFRTNYKGKENKKRPKSQVLFFERSREGNRAEVIGISEDGKLPVEQPKGYREFFLKEDFRVLGY